MLNKKLNFKKSLVAHALFIAFGGVGTTLTMSNLAYAQSNSTGSIFGQVGTPATASISIVNVETGLKRLISVDASGRFNASALPTGHYKVDLLRDGKMAESTEVDVILGQGSHAIFSNGTQTVEVSGRRIKIDVSNTNNGVIFTAKDLSKLPVSNNLNAIVLLAPNTTKADSAFGGASFGGSAASENAYYINGFPVTNPLSNLGSSELPFGAVGQASVITGGFGTEFGRSIGGVLSVTTKSGTNNWEGGASASISPNSLTSKTKNIYFPNTGQYLLSDGALHFRRELNTNDSSQSAFYLGGPIITDKLFMFIAVDRTVSNNGATNSETNTTLKRDGWNDFHNNNQRYVAKFDWNINDDHRLEWTSLGDDSKIRSRTYGYTQETGTHNDVKFSESNSTNASGPKTGAGSSINTLKYTGQLSNNLTLTAVYGENRATRGTSYENYNVDTLLRAIVADDPDVREPELEKKNLYQNYQKVLGNISLPGTDTVKSSRLDLEYKLGDHTLRAGLDDIKISSSNTGSFTAGGGTWTYGKVKDGAQNVLTNFSVGRPAILANYGGLGSKGYYVTLFTFSSVTDASARQSAQYFEDRYQVSKNLLLTAGLRNEQYSNSSGAGNKFIDVRNQIAPRFSAAWDVNGDASLKIFGSIGRYHLQLPSQVAARAAGVSSYLLQDFTYSGIDGQGQPTGLVKVNDPATPDGELGQNKDPRAVVTKDLKPNYQDELTLGFEHAFNRDFEMGVKTTFRKLKGGIDDSCDTRQISKYAREHGYTPDPYQLLCYIFNPGDDINIWSLDTTGKGRYVHISAADAGYPKAERNYAALDVYAEHPYRNGWYGKINYTLSRSYGNMEGQTRSDTQQSDIGISAAWDFPEFMANSKGVLPNDRTHVLKAYGFVDLDSEWSMGGNLLLSSGRPKLCLGTNTDLDSQIGYGAEYYYCDGKVSPRGSLGRMPTEKRLDMNITYKPNFLKEIALKMDIFNLTNDQTVLTRRETREDGAGRLLNNYGEARDTAFPRSVKFTIEYKHKF